MSKCICCGNETEGILCDSCRSKEDITKLCREIISYVPGTGEHPLWDQIASGLDKPEDFRNIVFALTDQMESPDKEILRIHCISGNSSHVPKASRSWLLETADLCVNDPATDEKEKAYLRGLELDALYKDYDYFGAEAIAEDLADSENLSAVTLFTLGEYYTQTRRYTLAKKILQQGIDEYPDKVAVIGFQEKLDDAKARELGKENGGKVQFMPNPRVNKTEVRQAYAEFLDSIGIEVVIPNTSRIDRRHEVEKNKMSRDEYPDPIEVRDSGFKNFVAFDLETTGVSTKIDAITEIGAIRVAYGKVVESKEFIFNELVHPYRKRIPEEVEEKTGITNEMVKDARDMWDVFSDFADFIGDDILVGYNCMRFDSRFLVRAGRYSRRIISNKYFDVMRMAQNIYGQNMSLEELSNDLQIENPQAHRALADAITTARVYLELLNKTDDSTEETLDDFLSGLENL